MIIEMRTYTVQPGSVALVEERSERRFRGGRNYLRSPPSGKTEFRVIHVWAYDSFEERTRIRRVRTS